MKNAQRHVRKVEKYPPTSGPIAIAEPIIAVQIANANTRRLPDGNSWLSSDIDDGTMTASTRPWITRPARRIPKFGAMPVMKLPTANSADPPRKALRAPTSASPR